MNRYCEGKEQPWSGGDHGAREPSSVAFPNFVSCRVAREPSSVAFPNFVSCRVAREPSSVAFPESRVMPGGTETDFGSIPEFRVMPGGTVPRTVLLAIAQMAHGTQCQLWFQP